MTERGIGCDECEGRGYIVNGPDTGVDNCTSYYPCPNCTPPDVPDDDFDDLWDDSGDDLDEDFEDDLTWTEDLLAEVE